MLRVHAPLSAAVSAVNVSTGAATLATYQHLGYTVVYLFWKVWRQPNVDGFVVKMCAAGEHRSDWLAEPERPKAEISGKLETWIKLGGQSGPKTESEAAPPVVARNCKVENRKFYAPARCTCWL